MRQDLERLLRLELRGMATIAILHEAGKVDIAQPIPDYLIPFFNALIHVIEKVKGAKP